MRSERRQSARAPLDLPMFLPDGTQARMRDVSSGGLYFTMPPGAHVDDWMHVEVAVSAAGLAFSAAGEVVRIERVATHAGVALRLHAARLEAID
jgi:hypothetical protein